MKKGLDVRHWKKEVWIGEWIDRDVSCGVWDEHWMVGVEFGGLVVVDLHVLEGLVA